MSDTLALLRGRVVTHGSRDPFHIIHDSFMSFACVKFFLKRISLRLFFIIRLSSIHIRNCFWCSSIAYRTFVYLEIIKILSSPVLGFDSF